MEDIMNDRNCSNMREMLKDCLCEIQSRAEKNSSPVISTGFKPIDDLTGGFEKGKVYVIGGRPCMGMEEFMLSMIRDILMESRLPVLLFSTNSMKPYYVQRLLSIHCNIPTLHLCRGLLTPDEWARLDRGVGTLIDAPLFIHNSLELMLRELKENADKCIREERTRIVFVDSLQMIDLGKDDRTSSERLAMVMCSLKQLACLFDIPVVVGSMLSRSIDYREGIEGKKPQLMDLANSSYIEGLADVIMMVHRPEYYRIYQDEHGRDLHHLMEIHVLKNSLKPLGSVDLEYHQETGIVTTSKDSAILSSTPVSLEELNINNQTLKKLIASFDLEEDLTPF